jgi:hypothetical protein
MIKLLNVLLIGFSFVAPFQSEALSYQKGNVKIVFHVSSEDEEIESTCNSKYCYSFLRGEIVQKRLSGEKVSSIPLSDLALSYEDETEFTLAKMEKDLWMIYWPSLFVFKEDLYVTYRGVLYKKINGKGPAASWLRLWGRKTTLASSDSLAKTIIASVFGKSRMDSPYKISNYLVVAHEGKLYFLGQPQEAESNTPEYNRVLVHDTTKQVYASLGEDETVALAGKDAVAMLSVEDVYDVVVEFGDVFAELRNKEKVLISQELLPPLKSRPEVSKTPLQSLSSASISERGRFYRIDGEIIYEEVRGEVGEGPTIRRQLVKHTFQNSPVEGLITFKGGAFVRDSKGYIFFRREGGFEKNWIKIGKFDQLKRDYDWLYLIDRANGVVKLHDGGTFMYNVSIVLDFKVGHRLTDESQLLFYNYSAYNVEEIYEREGVTYLLFRDGVERSLQEALSEGLLIKNAKRYEFLESNAKE